MADRLPKRFVAALSAGLVIGALASGARFAALSAQTLHAGAIVRVALAEPTPAAAVTPTPAAATSPAPAAENPGTPLPVPVVPGCANEQLPPAILAGSVAKPDHPLRVITAAAPKATLSLAVVATPISRELGLMCVTALRPHAGMIFVFAQSRPWEFWMKDTLVPLDMVWLDANGKVTSVSARVPESTLATSDAEVARRTGSGLYVIELGAGDAALDGIVKGAVVRLPALHAAQ